jgi:hypothetical protein
MKQYKIGKCFDLRWGMVAPLFYLRIFWRLVFMGWGKTNGGFEFRFDRR